MKIVLDTNVLISAIFFGGAPFQILEAWQESKIQICLSKEIIKEYQRVGIQLSNKYPSVNIKPIIEMLSIWGNVVETEGISVNICEDPDDNKFIECAIACNANIIVSGDKHLLKVSGHKNIRVLKPRGFINEYLQ